MFEDILDGFKDLEDELEKEQPGMTVPDQENVLSLADTGEWDTGKDDGWNAGEESKPDDKIWGV